MRTAYAFLAALSFSLIQCASASAKFCLKDQWIGKDFYKGWNWEPETDDDLTHGHVNYVSKADAIRKNLTYVAGNKFFMRADDVSIVGPKARGRDSIRISSKTAYDEAVIVLDLAHMPTGCATWPAFWTLSAKGPWPKGGEIDIIEGNNLRTVNQANLHTTPNCKMPPGDKHQPQSGTTLSTDCDSTKSNIGCGVSFTGSSPSFGAPFNKQGGGCYVVSRSRKSGIRMWFTPRAECPALEKRFEGQGESLSLDFLDLFPPAANFPIKEGYCDYKEHFDEHRLVFDLNFCGGWVGQSYSKSGCPGKCVDFVNKNASAFIEAYWAINKLRVYTPCSK
ncbi:concanavalin A-like lectin/glucanase domain-containing protein [Russula brevipes]|nr:concanavalin A-like lectin/glucanase domain-containing protein [Russula brevipes]